MNVRLIAAVAVIVLIAVALAVNLMAPRGEGVRIGFVTTPDDRRCGNRRRHARRLRSGARTTWAGRWRVST